MNILNRNSTTINIATFWENFQLAKYNFEPPYQRPSEVWSQSKQSFLIDTILKNFPMPPIFLHQHIDASTGKTMYDIIDGKQRLGAILAFIKNEIAIPENFNSDNFGDDRLDGIFFRDLESKDIAEWKKIFWRYELTIEYIDTDQIQIVNNIFDRLNRNGEPLTRQELRNARYHSTEFYKLIKELVKLSAFDPFFKKIQLNRLEHHEIVSELFLALFRNSVLAGDNQDTIDEEYESCDRSPEFQSHIGSYTDTFKHVSNYLNEIGLDYERLKIDGLSHLYALWYLSYIFHEQKITVPDLKPKLERFYSHYRQVNATEEMKQYKASMSSNTKSKSSRSRRINSLLKYLAVNLEF
ncbi:Protein of unknown function DUF262 [Chitinophaga sp. YR627]|uniref:DUF262 domain-containing protein n=1 Tax=Chitinophaga sp. YR627 TaxID=1881041 RepID=UPI0008E6BEBE|nr:DUF262 domain-containing protein [Chitinophaga sp. YR627]SFM78412.1 Protein of unknown function DUF262 [Chitinophaga sp. YR627]